MTLKLDISGLQQRVRGYDRASPAARLAAITDVMNPVMRVIVRATPTDTGRLRRGYAMAGNAAGLGPFPVPQVVPSRWQGRQGDVLARQAALFQRRAAHWERIIQTRYDQQGRTGKWRADAVRKRDAALRKLERAKAQIRKFEEAAGTAIVVGLFAQAGGKTGNQIATTVREKIYGGVGRRIHTDTFSGFQIHNLEPHATIVEHNIGIVRGVLGEAKALRVRRLGRKYLAELEMRSGSLAKAG